MHGLSSRLQDLIDGHPDVLQDREIAASSTGYEKSLYVANVWQKLRDEKRAHRKCIDPLVLGAPVLPHLVLIEVLDDGQDFCWRIFGSAHSDEYGTNLTGIRLNDLQKRNPAVEEVELIFRHCRETGAPTYYRIDYANERGCQRSCCGVILPLFDADDAEVTDLLGCSEWMDR